MSSTAGGLPPWDDAVLVTIKELEDKALRRAAVHVADRIAAANPHPLDDLDPRLAGRELAEDPVIAAGVRELLDALDLRGNR